MKKTIASIVVLSYLVGLTSCVKKQSDPISAAPLHSSSLDLEAIANKIIEKADPQPGEKVFMIGKPGEFDSLVLLLGEKISKAGANYLGTINIDSTGWPSSWRTEFVKSTDGKSKEELTGIFDLLDMGIMLPGAQPSDAPYGAWQEVMKQGKGRAVHFHWSGAFDLNGSALPIDSSLNATYQSVILNTDYTSLEKIQSEFEAAIRKEDVTLSTPAGNLTFKVGDRPVTRQDGDASKERSALGRNLIDREVELPAGAVRVSPLEETINGTISFPNSMWNDQRVEGLEITFNKGKITDINAREGKEFVISRLAGAKQNYLFREFALGFNPLLSVKESNPLILHYGYGAGIVRISFGNNEELGGIIRGDMVKINFIVDATVKVGNDTWVKDGKLVK